MMWGGRSSLANPGGWGNAPPKNKQVNKYICCLSFSPLTSHSCHTSPRKQIASFPLRLSLSCSQGDGIFIFLLFSVCLGTNFLYQKKAIWWNFNNLLCQYCLLAQPMVAPMQGIFLLLFRLNKAWRFCGCFSPYLFLPSPFTFLAYFNQNN